MKYGKLTSVLCASLILMGATALPLAAQNTFTAPEANVSWYGEEFQGRPTSSGELFDMNAFTAAHKTLPFGTLLEVTNLENGRKVIVRINDRGPFVADRELDISKAAAEVLDILTAGTARVSIREVSESEAVELVSAADAPESEAPADEPEVTVPAPVVAVAPIAPVPVTPAPSVAAAPEAPVPAEPEMPAPELAVAPAAPAPIAEPAPAPAPVAPAPAPAISQAPAAAIVPAPAQAAPAVPAPAPAIVQSPAAAVAPVRPAAPVQKPAPAVQAAPPAPIVVYTVPAPVKGIGWRIQLGSFTREENATRLVIKLRKAGFNPAFEKSDSMTRVVIAGIPDAELAATKEKLRLAGYADYLVRQESW